jgi:hypothetical protein
MDATPDQIWSLVTDVTKIGLYSPETFEAEWLDGATGPVVGARFRGHVKRNGRGPVYWSECKVMTADPGREFAFTVLILNKPVNTWTYHLEPTGDGRGADVTESFQLADNIGNRIYWAIAGRARNRTNLKGMRQTLERIKAVAEAAPTS